LIEYNSAIEYSVILYTKSSDYSIIIHLISIVTFSI